MTGRWAAIVLAGGRASRLGGIDKPALEHAGRSLLRHAVDAVGGADPVVVVGPRRPLGAAVTWTVERPAGGGPVAALAAGSAELVGLPDDTVVVLLAADLPAITSATVDRLLAAAGPAVGSVLVDDTGRDQWLTSAWPLGRLRAALPAEPAGAALRAVLRDLPARRVPAEPGETADIDTPADLDLLD